MPKCCYLAKGAKRPSHTTNMQTFSNKSSFYIPAVTTLKASNLNSAVWDRIFIFCCMNRPHFEVLFVTEKLILHQLSASEFDENESFVGFFNQRKMLLLEPGNLQIHGYIVSVNCRLNLQWKWPELNRILYSEKEYVLAAASERDINSLNALQNILELLSLTFYSSASFLLVQWCPFILI